MISKEEEVKELKKLLNYMADIDCYDITKMQSNAKNLHKAYNIGDLLVEKIMN